MTVSSTNRRRKRCTNVFADADRSCVDAEQQSSASADVTIPEQHSDPIDPAMLGDDFRLRLVHDDTAGTLEYRYSIDGGATYTSMTEFLVPGEPARDFPPEAGAKASFEGQTSVLGESTDG